MRLVSPKVGYLAMWSGSACGQKLPMAIGSFRASRQVTVATLLNTADARGGGTSPWMAFHSRTYVGP